MRSTPFRRIAGKKIVETTAEDLRQVMAQVGTSTNLFLRCLHNLALGMGWLTGPILPAKFWPARKTKPKRGITAEEHARILAAEKDDERRHYYELIWEIGAAQTDAALLTAGNIDWSRNVTHV